MFDPRNIFVSKNKEFAERFARSTTRGESGLHPGKVLEFNMPESYFKRYGEQLIHANEELYKTPAKKSSKTKKTSKKRKPKAINDDSLDSGIVIVDDSFDVDKSQVNEERRAYLEEARSQDASD